MTAKTPYRLTIRLKKEAEDIVWRLKNLDRRVKINEIVNQIIIAYPEIRTKLNPETLPDLSR